MRRQRNSIKGDVTLFKYFGVWLMLGRPDVNLLVHPGNGLVKKRENVTVKLNCRKDLEESIWKIYM